MTGGRGVGPDPVRQVVPADDAPTARVVVVDDRAQSHVDLADPTRLRFPYVRRLGDVLDAREPRGEPVRVVHVGGAGLTLPRYVAATRPRSSQVVLEPDAALTALVREALPLPPRCGIRVRPLAGRPGLDTLPAGGADVVVLDAFDRGRVPADLVDATALGVAARALRPDGWWVANLVDAPPFDHTRRVLAGVRAHLPRLLVAADRATLRGRGSGRGGAGNLVVVASRGSLPLAALRRRAVSADLPYRVLDDAAARDRLGGGRPFSDDDAAPGPDRWPAPGGA